MRKEYCLLIGEIYRTYKIPNAQFELIFPTMAHIAVNDLYWEAKVSALHFFRQVIVRQFKYNGVIDGAFPAMTFSKKHKKIVTLTPREIQLRIDLILEESTNRGALGVLLECLGDECDLEVVKSAHAIALRVQQFLNQYEYRKGPEATEAAGASTTTTAATKTIVPTADTNFAELSLRDTQSVNSRQNRQSGDMRQPQQPPIASGSSAAPSPAHSVQTPPIDVNSTEADRIIAAIVSQDDINLLGDTKVTAEEAAKQTPEASSSPHLDPLLFQRMRSVRTAEYLQRIEELQLATLVERRGAWIRKNESFESLLDDMMFSLQIGDANNADCY